MSFMDRENERQIIKDSLEHYQSVFIYANTGIGKDALCTEVLKNNQKSVKIKHRNKKELFDEGDVIIQMRDAISSRSKQLKVETYRKYMRKRNLKYTFANIFHAIGNFQLRFDTNIGLILILPFIAIIKLFIVMFVPQRIRDSWRQLDSSKITLVSSKKYLSKVLDAHRDIIFDINNIQAIDKFSFECILEFIETLRIRFLLQFNGDRISGAEFFEDNFTKVQEHLCPLQLTSLPIEEVRKLINEIYANKSVDKKKLLDEFRSSGNLNNIVTINIAPQRFTLNNHEQAVVFLVRILKKNVSTSKLVKYMKLTNPLPKREIKKIIRGLVDKKILYRTNHFYFAYEIKFDENKIVKRVILDILQKEYDKRQGNSFLLYKLIPVFLELNVDGILQYLPEVRDIMLQLADNHATLKFLDSFTIELEKQRLINDKSILLIVDIYYSLAMYEEAYAVLKKHQSEQIIFKIYEAMILNRQDQHHESIAIIDEIYPLLTDREKLVALNINFINYASLRNQQGKKAMYDAILEIQNVAQYPEYQYTLRNSHQIVDRKCAIKKIKKSIAYFKRHQNYRDSNRAKISLAIIYIIEKRDKIARNILNKIISNSYSQACELTLAHNNLATINMVNGYYLTAEKDLSYAENYSIDRFDTLSIYGNILTTKTQLNDAEGGLIYLNKILTLINNEPDKKLKSCLYDEISQYYKMLKDERNAQLYGDLSQNMLDEISTDHKTTNMAVTTKHGYIINQLAFWHFDLFQLIEHSLQAHVS